MTVQFLYIAAVVLFVLGACVFIVHDEIEDRKKMRELNEAFANGADAYWENLATAYSKDRKTLFIAIQNPHTTSKDQHQANLYMAWERGYNQARQIRDKQLSNRDAINL